MQPDVGGWVQCSEKFALFRGCSGGHELRVVCSTKCAVPEVFTKSCLFIYITHILVCTMSHVLGGFGIACCPQYSIGCSTHAVGLQYSVKYRCWVWSTIVQYTVPILGVKYRCAVHSTDAVGGSCLGTKCCLFLPSSSSFLSTPSRLSQSITILIHHH